MKYLTWLLTLLIFLACQNEQREADTEVSQTEEEMYFEDYVAAPNKWGYLNAAGEVEIPAKFDAVRDFRSSLAPVNFQGKWGIIDLQGNWKIPPEYQGIWPFSEGLARVKVFEEGYGFVDMDNKMVIEPVFENVLDFSDGLACAEENGYFGYIDKSGEWIIPPRYQSAQNFVMGLGVVQMEDLFGIINKTGDLILPMEFDRISIDESYESILAKKDNQYFHYSLEMVPISSKGYSQATHFYQGKAWVGNNEQWTLIDKTERPLRTLQAKQILIGGEDRWIARISGGFTLLDLDGNILTDELYTQINRFSNERAVFLKKNRWGYLDPAGREVIAPSYLLIWDFQNNLARVADESGTYFIDPSGNKILSAPYADIRDFHNNRARFQEL